MSGPSKEALEVALKLYKRPSEQPGNIARALQKLMDERDSWHLAAEQYLSQRDYFTRQHDAWKQRAEAAEAKTAAVIAEARAHIANATAGIAEARAQIANATCWQQRTEAAEARIDDLSRELTAEIEAHRVTRETLCEVREWNRVSFGVRWPSLEAILDRHEPKP